GVSPSRGFSMRPPRLPAPSATPGYATIEEGEANGISRTTQYRLGIGQKKNGKLAPGLDKNGRPCRQRRLAKDDYLENLAKRHDDAVKPAADKAAVLKKLAR